MNFTNVIPVDNDNDIRDIFGDIDFGIWQHHRPWVTGVNPSVIISATGPAREYIYRGFFLSSCACSEI